MKKLLSILLAVVCAAGSVSFSAAVSAASSSYAQLISAGFPSSYATKLSALKDKYPNWNFEPMFVGEELDEAVANERSPHSQQLIQKHHQIIQEIFTAHVLPAIKTAIMSFRKEAAGYQRLKVLLNTI